MKFLQKRPGESYKQHDRRINSYVYVLIGVLSIALAAVLGAYSWHKQYKKVPSAEVYDAEAAYNEAAYRFYKGGN